MSIQSISGEPAQAQRLLLVELEAKEGFYSNYRHIRATVVRYAVSHKIGENGRIAQWNDDHNSTGYRNAVWSSAHPTKAIYVAGLRLRGQIDIDPLQAPLQEGRPYGNRVEYSTGYVETDSAKAMHEGFTKMNKAHEKLGAAARPDEFVVQLGALASILGISKFLFYKNATNQNSNLGLAGNFEEANFSEACFIVKGMLEPFYVKA